MFAGSKILRERFRNEQKVHPAVALLFVVREPGLLAGSQRSKGIVQTFHSYICTNTWQD
jgi:hypothetical protein